MTQADRKKIPTLYNIPAGISFVDALSAGLLTKVGDAREKLANYLILLPTRRACRSLRDAFLRQTEGQPILLPKMQPFGDIDADELQISMQGSKTAEAEMTISPAISPLKRQILLARTISRLPRFTKGPEQDMALAQALGHLMDQIYTENLDLADLPNLVDRDAFADHWQITVDFLSILSEHWPQILAEQGVIDAADRRNRLMNALNDHWQKNPPAYPVIAAGSTGSIPATTHLLKTISMLPQGAIILPGLDQHMTMEAWQQAEEGHPQFTLKTLLENLDCTRQDVKDWPSLKEDTKDKQKRRSLASDIMLPPEQTGAWQKIHLTKNNKDDLIKSMASIKRYDCSTAQEEAQLIAVLMRETLEEKSKTAALITPDRNLARRVGMACRRWNIEVDDSAGYSLADSEVGSYLRLCARSAVENIRPVSFLALLKHTKAQGGGFKNFRSTVYKMDKELLRGSLPPKGLYGIKQLFESKINNPDIRLKPSENILNLLNHLQPIMKDIIEKFSDGFHDFSGLLNIHLQFAETLAADGKISGDTLLWSGEEGEAAALFFADLRDHARHMPRVNGTDYLAILEQLMQAVAIRPRYGTHPRLMILGQLEARLVQADRVILAGLNEGCWPPDPGHDPWMSRPMRKSFGLPAPERSITLAAHDFAQGFCNDEVFLIRAERADGAPTVSARWLQRLDTYLQVQEIDPAILRQGPHKNYLQMLDKNEAVTPVNRPAPTPPALFRPDKLSVTKIETWLKDPYSIYAEKILRLKKLEAIEKIPDAADKGNLLHDIMEKFTDIYKKEIPDAARTDFITIARDVLNDQTHDPAEWNFWLPRMIRLANWIVPHEQKWRETARFNRSEVEGEFLLQDNLARPFTLTARADRIDNLNDGTAAIIDYKSGGTFTKSKMESGELPQLPLEALILENDGFAKSGIHNKKTGSISYWKLTGGSKPGEITSADDHQKLEQTITNAATGLLNLLQVFEQENTPYYAIPRLDNAPRFNDYEYLERVKEWAALGENSEEAA